MTINKKQIKKFGLLFAGMLMNLGRCGSDVGALERQRIIGEVRQGTTRFEDLTEGFIEDLAEGFRNDRDVVMAAVKKNGFALLYASEGLRNDRGVVMAAVKQNGLALEHASEGFRNDKGVVIEAVMQYGWALRHASEGFRNTIKDEVRSRQRFKAASRFPLLIQATKVTQPPLIEDATKVTQPPLIEDATKVVTQPPLIEDVVSIIQAMLSDF